MHTVEREQPVWVMCYFGPLEVIGWNGPSLLTSTLEFMYVPTHITTHKCEWVHRFTSVYSVVLWSVSRVLDFGISCQNASGCVMGLFSYDNHLTSGAFMVPLHHRWTPAHINHQCFSSFHKCQYVNGGANISMISWKAGMRFSSVMLRGLFHFESAVLAWKMISCLFRFD